MAEWLYGALLLAWIVAQIGLDRRHRRAGRNGRAVFPAWAGLIGLPVAFLTIVCREWAHVETQFQLDHYWMHRFVQVFTYGIIVSYLSAAVWPGEQLLAAVKHLEDTEVQLRAARKWVQICHEMIAKGESASLADAEAAVERWTRERDKALEKAEQLGYRARFRRV